MTVAHILIILAFICLGSAGLAAIQDGLSTVWQHLKHQLGIQPREKFSVTRTMRIIS